MSALIKSNVNYAGPLYPATYTQLSTTAQDAFNAYKARVLADGGVVNDEAATLNAFNFMFANKIMGKVNTFISPKFGVKLDGVGGVLKAYSLDGDDMVGKVFGTGALPKIIDNHFKFNPSLSSAEATNGAILTTEIKSVRTNKNRYLQAFKIKNIGSTASVPISQLTNHEDYTMPATVAGAFAVNSRGGEVWLRHVTSPFSLTNSAITTSGAILNSSAGSTIVYALDGVLNLMYSYRDGTGQQQQGYDWILPDISKTEFYVDLGGMWKSATNKSFSNLEIGCYISLKDFVRETALAVDAHIKANY